jgi:hypothetical protein
MGLRSSVDCAQPSLRWLPIPASLPICRSARSDERSPACPEARPSTSRTSDRRVRAGHSVSGSFRRLRVAPYAGPSAGLHRTRPTGSGSARSPGASGFGGAVPNGVASGDDGGAAWALVRCRAMGQAVRQTGNGPPLFRRLRSAEPRWLPIPAPLPICRSARPVERRGKPRSHERPRRCRSRVRASDLVSTSFRQPAPSDAVRRSVGRGAPYPSGWLPRRHRPESTGSGHNGSPRTPLPSRAEGVAYFGGRERRRRSRVGVFPRSTEGLDRAGSEEFAEVGDCEGDCAAFGGEDEAFFDEAVSGWGEGLGFAAEGGGYFGGGDRSVVDADA